MKESDKLNFYLYELTEGIDIQQQGWFQFFLHDLTYVKGYLIIEIFFSLGLVDPTANEEPKATGPMNGSQAKLPCFWGLAE